MNLSNGVTPEDDTVHVPRDIPNWSESFAWWTWDERNDLTVYAHFQRHPDEPMLWRAFCTVMIGDQIWVHHSYGRERPDREGPGYESCHVRVERPHRRWRLVVDAAGIQRASPDLHHAAITDGPAAPMAIDLVLECRTPVWSLGKSAADTAEIMVAHHEQKGWCTGQIRLGERHYAIDALGANDHSHGPRDTSHLVDGSGFFNCAFPSGRSLTGIQMSAEATLGYLNLGDGRLLTATKVVMPQGLGAPGSTGVLRIEAGEIVAELAVEVTDRCVALTLAPPNFEHVGLLHGAATKLSYVDRTCRVTWDGELGAGAWETCRIRA